MKVYVLFYWDTRPELLGPWKYNKKLMAHNLAEMTKREEADGITVDVSIRLNWIGGIRPDKEADLLDFTQEVAELYHATVHFDTIDYRPLVKDKHGHLIFFNKIALKALESMQTYLFDYDWIFTISQDTLLINHYDDNLFVVLDQMATRSAHQDLGRYPGHEVSYNYVGHTVYVDRMLTHNAGLSRGMFRSRELGNVLRACRQEKKAAEVFLGRDLGKKCVFLQPHPLFWYSDFSLASLTEEKADRLLEIANDATLTHKLQEERHW